MAIKIHLDDILKERNMTSKELCKKVHITEANLSILRSGKAKGVRFSTINKICYYLECDVGDILKFDGRLEEEDEQGNQKNRSIGNGCDAGSNSIRMRLAKKDEDGTAKKTLYGAYAVVGKSLDDPDIPDPEMEGTTVGQKR